ncbi:MAG: glycosyltransferase [Fusicatenibacter sp.]|nr:glycosyltransferase [Fusicatenibacter sp.]
MNQKWKRVWEKKPNGEIRQRIKQDLNFNSCCQDLRILLFMIIPFFKPVCIQYISWLKVLEMLMIIWKMGAAFLIGILLIQELQARSKIPGLIWLVSVFEFSIFFSTIIHQGYLQRALIDMVSMVAFVSLLFYGIKTNSERFLKLLCWILRIFLLADFCSMIIFPDGIPADLYFNNSENPLYFMTIDNGSALFLLFCMMVFAIEFDRTKGKQFKLQLFFLLCCPICAALSHSGTSIVVVGLFTILLIVIYHFGDKFRFRWKEVCVVYSLVAIGVILAPQSTIIQIIMTKIFHYSADLSGRSLLWSVAIAKIKHRILFGYGRAAQDYIPAWGGYFSSHNFWLELILQGGFVAMLLFAVCVSVCFSKSERHLQTRQGKAAAFAFLTMMISAMMESAVHSVYLFGAMTFLYCSKWLQKYDGKESDATELALSWGNKIASTQKKEIAVADLVRPVVEQNVVSVGAGKRTPNPVLSVIIPVYNGERFLNQLISCIIIQHLENMELILVDDGSTDQTLKLCREFEKSYTWIRVLHTENLGVSHARNTGLVCAKGKWIHFMDSDDQILPGMYRNFLKMAENGKDSPEVVICGCVRIGANDGKQTVCGPEESGVISGENIPKLFDRMSMERRYYLLDYIWNKWYRRDVIERYRIRFPKQLSLGEDFAFNAEYFQHVKKIALLSDCFYQYQIQEDGLVSRFREDPWKGRNILYREQTALYQKLGLFPENEKWIQRQAGQIAFGDIRTISSVQCPYDWKEKKKFVQKMMKSSQYGWILEYLKARGENSLIFRWYFYLFALRRVTITTGIICLERMFLNCVQKVLNVFHGIRIRNTEEKV